MDMVTMVELEATTTMGTMVVAVVAVIMEVVVVVDKIGGIKPLLLAFVVEPLQLVFLLKLVCFVGKYLTSNIM